MRLMLGLAAVATTACTFVPNEPVQPLRAPTATFNPDEVAWFSKPGTNTISGNAVLRTVGGEARTCAGLEVHLIPVSAYATERMTIIYGTDAKGYLPATTRDFAETDPRYIEASRETRCDAQGDFQFTNLPDGDYYVTAQVVWGVPGQYITRTQGGVLMQRVSVSGGETERIVLTAS